MAKPWENLSAKTQLSDEDLKAICYWFEKSDESKILVLKDGTFVVKAHLKMTNWKCALEGPNKGVEYEEEILNEISTLPEEKQKRIEKESCSEEKRWMKHGSKYKACVYRQNPDCYCRLAIFLSLPFEWAGMLLRNTDISIRKAPTGRPGQEDCPIELIEWILDYLSKDPQRKNDVANSLKDFLKAEKDGDEQEAQNKINEINEILFEVLGISNGEQLKEKMEKDLDEGNKRSSLLIHACDGVYEEDLYSYQFSKCKEAGEHLSNLAKKGACEKEAYKSYTDYLCTEKLKDRMKRNSKDL